MVRRRLQSIFQDPAGIGQKKRAVARNIFLCGLLCLLFSLQMKAQYVYRNYSTINGLPSSQVYHCVQDSAGFIWFATDKGLCRFDGSDFVDFDLNEYGGGSSTVVSLSFSKNKIIAGTHGGFLILDNQSRIKKLGLGIANVDYAGNQQVYEGNFFYFRTTDGHVAAYDVTRKKKYLIGKQDIAKPFCIAKTSDGHVYYGQDGLHALDGLTTFKLKVPVLANKEISALSVDADDQVWISAGNMIYCMKDEVIRDSVKCHFYKGKTLFVYNSRIFGLLIYDHYGHGNDAYQQLSALLNQGSVCMITDMFEDRDANLWVNTYNKGSFCVLNSYISVFSGNNEVYDASIHDVFVSKAEAYMATSLGIVYKSGNSFRRLGHMPQHFYYSITRAGNALLAGVSHMEAGRLEKVEDKATGKVYYQMLARRLCMMNDSEVVYNQGGNTVLVASPDFRKGVLRGKDTIRLDTAVGQCTAIFRKSRSQLIVSTTGACYLVDLEKKTSLRMKEIRSKVNDIIADASGTVYLASEAGLYVLRDNRAHLVKALRGTLLKKLSSLAIDGKGRLWIGFNKGLLVWKGDFLRRISGSPFMRSHEINRLLYERTINSVYVATSSGLSVIDIQKMDNVVARRPDIILLKVQSGDSIYDATKEVRLDSDHDAVDIYFSAVELSSPHDLYFRYTLNKGLSWTIFGVKKISLREIDYGEHDVMIQASTNGVNWGRPAELTITSDYPFYITLGFWLKVLALALIVVFVLVKLRILKIREKAKKEVELLQKLEDLRYQALSAAVNPHFIFNTLGAIQSFVINKDPFEASDYIAKFARLIRITLSYAGEKYISIREEENRLNLYLALEKLRCGDKLEYSVHVHGSVDKYSLIPNMIIQPLLENAILHGILPLRIGVTGQLDVSIAQENNCLIIRVRDNGVGITRHEHSKHGYVSIGIDNLKERLSLVKGSEFTIKNLRESYPGDRGTLVEIKIPM
jgi:hypothetical protein